MLKDALSEVFEENYKRQDNEAFLNLVDPYSKGRSDAAVREMIEAIYYKAGSSSWPKKWISGLSGLYEVASVKEFERSEVIKELMKLGMMASVNQR